MSNKPISHFEQLSARHPIQIDIKLDDRYTFGFEQSLNESTQVVVRKCVKKIISRNPFEHLNVTDFSLENLISANVELKPCSLSLSQHQNLSQIESTLSNLIKSTNQTTNN